MEVSECGEGAFGTGTPTNVGPQTLPVSGDRDGTVPVRTQNACTHVPQCTHRTRRRVAIGVSPAHGDQGESGTRRGEQFRMLMGRTVVGDLQDVHPREPRVLDQQTALGRRFKVSEHQQGRPPCDLDP